MTIMESFATITALASAFATGRDTKNISNLLAFQEWLVKEGHKDLSNQMDQSHETTVYIKAILNQQLPLIIESINEVTEASSALPDTLKSVLDSHTEVLHKAVVRLEQKMAEITPTHPTTQTSSGDRTLNIVSCGNGDVHANTGDTIHNQVIYYGISREEHENALKEREQEIREDLLNSAESSDRLIREVLEKEYNALKKKLSNIEQSYKDEIETRKEVAKTLKTLEAELPETQVESALAQLEAGNTSEAKSLFDRTIQKAERNNELAGQAAYSNGRISEAEVRYTEAKEYYLKAVRFQPENSLYINAVGIMMIELGEYQQALDYYERALERDLKIYHDDHPEVATRRSNLGSVHQFLGEYHIAIEYFKQALAGHIASYGGSHPTVATDYNNLGAALQCIGEYESAIQYHHKALKSDRITYGEGHLTVARSRSNLGSAHQALGQHKTALCFYKLALDSDLNSYGEHHPSVARCHNNLGSVYHSLGKHETAKKHFRKALDSDLNNYDENHPSVAKSRHNLGTVYQSLGQYETASGYHLIALKSNLENYGEIHPLVASSRNLLGLDYYYLGQFEAAIEQLDQALDTYLKLHVKGHPSVATPLTNLGLVYCSLGLYERADEHFQQALKICEETVGRQHPLTRLVVGHLSRLHNHVRPL